QAVATLAAMTSNFFLNNVFTYGDQRLRGRAMWRGLLSFYAACGIGALINLAIAEWLFLKSLPYWVAGLGGASIAALWNFFTTASFTWGGHLFPHLPFGSVAYRVHLASALFGALTGGAAWLCARALIGGRLPAYLAAFALGVSPVFWSQAIIAEVYTFNTFFFLVLVFMGLQACPPSTLAPANPGASRWLPWMALVFGLSLSNPYPLLLIVAPAFVLPL